MDPLIRRELKGAQEVAQIGLLEYKLNTDLTFGVPSQHC